MSKKISELTETTTPTASDVLPIVNNNETKKVSIGNVANTVKTVLNLDNEYSAVTHTHTKSEITDFPTIPTKTSELVNDSGYMTEGSVPTHVKNITTEDIASWNGKQEKLTAGANITIVDNVISSTGGGGEGGTTDYTALTNKPKINGVELLGNKTSADLGIQTLVAGANITIVDNVISSTGGGTANILVFENITVATSSWIEDTTYEEFGYKAEILCEGVTDEFFSDVVFGVSEAISGNYAPISVTGAGTVTIYAVDLPANDITIPTILCSKGD